MLCESVAWLNNSQWVVVTSSMVCQGHVKMPYSNLMAFLLGRKDGALPPMNWHFVQLLMESHQIKPPLILLSSNTF